MIVAGPIILDGLFFELDFKLMLILFFAVIFKSEIVSMNGFSK